MPQAAEYEPTQNNLPATIHAGTGLSNAPATQSFTLAMRRLTVLSHQPSPYQPQLAQVLVVSSF